MMTFLLTFACKCSFLVFLLVFFFVFCSWLVSMFLCSTLIMFRSTLHFVSSCSSRPLPRTRGWLHADCLPPQMLSWSLDTVFWPAASRERMNTMNTMNMNTMNAYLGHINKIYGAYSHHWVPFIILTMVKSKSKSKSRIYDVKTISDMFY